MKRTILLILSLCLLFSTTSLSQEKSPSINYEKIANKKYKELESNKTIIESWKVGLQTYDLTFDRIRMHFTETHIIVTTDNKIIQCGQLLIVVYAKTSENNKKRVISKREVCHLFDEETIMHVWLLSISNKIVDGWDEITARLF